MRGLPREAGRHLSKLAKSSISCRCVRSSGKADARSTVARYSARACLEEFSTMAIWSIIFVLISVIMLGLFNIGVPLPY